QAQSWAPGDAVPAGYHVATRPLTGLVVAGSIILSLAVIGSLTVGFSNSANGGDATLLPVVGSFAAVAAYPDPPCPQCAYSPFSRAAYGGFLIPLGILRVVGAAL